MFNYLKHLIANWRVALHALNDFAEHFLHGLIPAIKWDHNEKSIDKD
jgi:hypothetical protein